MSQQLKNYINGEWVEAKSGKTTDVINPADGKTYLQAPLSGAEDVDAAIAKYKQEHADDYASARGVYNAVTGFDPKTKTVVPPQSGTKGWR